VWQVSKNSKLALYGDNHSRCIPCAYQLSSSRTFEATTRLVTPISRIMQATWNWTVSNRLLIELGETYKPDAWYYKRQTLVRDDLSSITDSGRGISFRAPGTETGQVSKQQNGKAGVTYVTGSHSFKSGAQWFNGTRTRPMLDANQSSYTFTNGVPTSVTA